MVEQQDQRQFEIANHLEESRGVARRRIDQAPSKDEVNAAAPQFRDEGGRNLRGEKRRVSAVWEMRDGAVLGDDTVDEMQIAGHATQLVEDPAGHEEHRIAACSRVGNRVAHRWIERLVVRDRTVVVEREHRRLHPDPLSTS